MKMFVSCIFIEYVGVRVCVRVWGCVCDCVFVGWGLLESPKILQTSM